MRRRWSDLPAWRKLCALALIAAGIFTVFRMGTRELASATLVLKFGDAGAAIRTLDVELVDPKTQDQLATFHKLLPKGASEVRFDHRGEAGTVLVRSRIETARGIETLERTVVVEDDATVTVNFTGVRTE